MSRYHEVPTAKGMGVVGTLADGKTLGDQKVLNLLE
jgi:hypothetical protein